MKKTKIILSLLPLTFLSTMLYAQGGCSIAGKTHEDCMQLNINSSGQNINQFTITNVSKSGDVDPACQITEGTIKDLTLACVLYGSNAKVEFTIERLKNTNQSCKLTFSFADKIMKDSGNLCNKLLVGIGAPNKTFIKGIFTITIPLFE